MQTFLPSRSFYKSASILDNKRLGKQRVECKQILKALNGEYAKTGAWVNHPATRMWRGHEGALAHYGFVMCQQWRDRGFNDSLLPFFADIMCKVSRKQCTHPEWMMDDGLFASHRSNLLRKDANYYGQFGWKEDDSLPYIWPV